MFSGIVEGLGTVRQVEGTSAGKRFVIAPPPSFYDQGVTGIPIGSSIAVDGVCLTVVNHSTSTLSFDVVSETLRRSSLGELTIGSLVNMERSLRVSDRIDGHFVFGHVDATTTLRSRSQDGDSWHLTIGLPADLRPYIVEKGSVTLSGISLTVGKVRPDDFDIYMIPHTAEITTLSRVPVGGMLNIEVDMIARYVVKLMQAHLPGPRG